MPNTTKIIFVKKAEIVSGVTTFIFKPERGFDFIPGQFVKILFDEENEGNKELNKFLSLSCAPGREEISVTKKISESDFSQKLCSLTKDDEVLIKGPMGKCVLDKEIGKVGFFVGGIGITPVISMLENIVMNHISCDLHLIYGNWKEDQIAFKDDLDYWSEKSIDQLKVTHVIAEPESEGKYIKGFITKEVIEAQMPDYQQRKIYVLGPPKMVETVKSLCQEMGIKDEKLITESFMGY